MGNNGQFSDYVPLGRSFRELPSDASARDDTDWSKFLSWRASEKLGWGELLKDYRVVILSKAGSGKTKEFLNISNRLRDEGKDAFFLRLENVPQHFRSAFEVGDIGAFDAWLASGREGWLFLDSVDEARLRHPRDFELALRELGGHLKLALERTHIYLSGRMSAWRPRTDLECAQNCFPFTADRREVTGAHEDGERTGDSDSIGDDLSGDDSGQSSATTGETVSSAPSRQ